MCNPKPAYRFAAISTPSIGKSARLHKAWTSTPIPSGAPLKWSSFQHAEPLRPSILDPYLPFVREVLEQHPPLRATRLHQMIRGRGYAGSVEQLRRVVARLRPQPREAFLRLQEIGTAILSSCPSKPVS